MVPKPELIKGGGGSIRVGTTGTISSLITRELEHRAGPPPQTPISSKRKPPSIPVSVPSVSTSKTSVQRRRTSHEASSSSTSTSTSTSTSMSNINRRSPVANQKARQNNGKTTTTHNIPMLGSEDIALERTPYRAKPIKKKPNIVEVVDIRCGKTEKAWSTPISNRLKKLSFSKLSVSIG